MDYMTLPGASVKMFKKGETLINQGEAIRYVYYLIDGIVHRNVLTERGLETTLTIKSDHMKHEIEAVIGVLIIYSAEVDQPKVAQSSFIAKTDCKCIQIPVQSFLKYAYQDRDALESIVRYAMDNYTHLLDMYRVRQDKDMVAKVCMYLLEQSEGKNGACLIKDIPKNIDLAYQLGVHAVTISRIMGKLKEEEIIKKRKNGLEITDMERLENLAHHLETISYRYKK